MTDKLENSSKKCRYENIFNQDHDEEEAPANATHDVKSITNIYYDCLERIFDFLELQDLLNVALTCKRLQIAAAAKFGDVYGKKRIVICLNYTYENELIQMNDGTSIEITVRGLKTCLTFLRCFGSKILDLFVRRHCPGNNCVDQYVNQYCAETVLHIDILCQDRFHFTKPFKNVEKLDLYGKNSRNGLSNLVKWFPKLRYLRICCDYINSSSFGVFFPHLEQVRLSFAYNLLEIGETWEFEAITDPNVRDKLNIENAKELLRANQQLTYIDIDSSHLEFTMTTLLNLISSNPSISTLHVKSKTTMVTTDEIKRLTREHRFIVDLELFGYRFTSEQVIIIIRQLKSLEKMRVILKNRLDFEHLMRQKGNVWENKVLHPFHFHDNIEYTGYVRVSLKRR